MGVKRNRSKCHVGVKNCVVIGFWQHKNNLVLKNPNRKSSDNEVNRLKFYSKTSGGLIV